MPRVSPLDHLDKLSMLAAPVLGKALIVLVPLLEEAPLSRITKAKAAQKF